MERELCSAVNPYTKERDKPGTRWAHTEVVEVPDSQKDGYPGGDIVTMKCNTCGITWETELPQ